ncbi:MAG: hypothetical protein WKF35_10485 [Ferruginibacter sp.]
MKWFHFILSHSIFISLCATALCYQSYLLLNIQPDNRVCFMLFFSTLCSYNLYWLISKYFFNEEKNLIFFLKKNISYLVFFITAAVIVTYYLFIIPGIFPFALISILLTLLYSLPLWPIRIFSIFRNAGFIKTLLLAFTWTYGTLMLPLQVNFFKITPEIAMLFIARFSFMLMLCAIFDSRDIVIDKMRSLKSLATDLSPLALKIIMGISFFIYISAGILLRLNNHDTAQLTAFLITGVMVFIVYRCSLRVQNYIFYYFIVDGLMLFSAAATYMASI